MLQHETLSFGVAVLANTGQAANPLTSVWKWQKFHTGHPSCSSLCVVSCISIKDWISTLKDILCFLEAYRCGSSLYSNQIRQAFAIVRQKKQGDETSCSTHILNNYGASIYSQKLSCVTNLYAFLISHVVGVFQHPRQTFSYQKRSHVEREVFLELYSTKIWFFF